MPIRRMELNPDRSTITRAFRNPLTGGRVQPIKIDLISEREEQGLEIDRSLGSEHQNRFRDIVVSHKDDLVAANDTKVIDYFPEYLNDIGYDIHKHDMDAFEKAGVYQKELSRDMFSAGTYAIGNGATYDMRAARRIKKIQTARQELARTEAITDLLGYPNRAPQLNSSGIGKGGTGSSSSKGGPGGRSGGIELGAPSGYDEFGLLLTLFMVAMSADGPVWNPAATPDLNVLSQMNTDQRANLFTQYTDYLDQGGAPLNGMRVVENELLVENFGETIRREEGLWKETPDQLPIPPPKLPPQLHGGTGGVFGSLFDEALQRTYGNDFQMEPVGIPPGGGRPRPDLDLDDDDMPDLEPVDNAPGPEAPEEPGLGHPEGDPLVLPFNDPDQPELDEEEKKAKQPQPPMEPKEPDEAEQEPDNEIAPPNAVVPEPEPPVADLGPVGGGPIGALPDGRIGPDDAPGQNRGGDGGPAEGDGQEQGDEQGDDDQGDDDEQEDDDDPEEDPEEQEEQEEEEGEGDTLAIKICITKLAKYTAKKLMGYKPKRPTGCNIQGYKKEIEEETKKEMEKLKPKPGDPGEESPGEPEPPGEESPGQSPGEEFPGQSPGDISPAVPHSRKRRRGSIFGNMRNQRPRDYNHFIAPFDPTKNSNQTYLLF